MEDGVAENCKGEPVASNDRESENRPDPEGFGRVLERMRSDLRLAIVTLYTICVSAAVGSFGIYRMASGDPLIGFVDLLIVAVFVVLAALAWQPGRTRLAANITAAVAAGAVVGVVLLLGLSPLWMFSTVVANFLMADRRIAIIVNAAMIATIALNPGVSPSMTEHVTLTTVAIVTSLFSLIFAGRVHSQRKQLSRLAERDGLTGAFNRRSLDHELDGLVKHASAAGESNCLALLDLDDFKALNDSLGHDAGDQALITLASVVGECTRENDRFYRYGGEEFVLLLPRTTCTGAERALNNLREAYAAAMSGQSDRVTFSAGVAEHLPGESATDWVTRADDALLKAKRNGKDRIEFA